MRYDDDYRIEKIRILSHDAIEYSEMRACGVSLSAGPIISSDGRRSLF